MMKNSKIQLSAFAVMGALFAAGCASDMGVDLQNAEGTPLAEDGEVSTDRDSQTLQPGENEADVSAEVETLEAEIADGAIMSEAEEEEDAELGTLQQALGGSCGSTSTPLNSVYYYTTVPDHFPPDSGAAQLAALFLGVPLGGLAACVPFGIANMHSTCDAHDACYATLGKSKSTCDKEARAGWERACKRTYDSIGTGDVLLGVVTGGLTSPLALAEQACRESCLGMAQVMYAAVARAGQSAYDRAQYEASIPRLGPEDITGPIFF